MPSMGLRQKEMALANIAAKIANCRQCKIGKHGKPVAGEGSANAAIAFIGEAPGKLEAQIGRPFIGRAGQLLRKLIAETGLAAEDVYITSPVKYLPDYVTPKPADIAHGKKHLDEQLAIIQPQIIVLLGSVACLALLGEKIAVAKEHGKIIIKDNCKYFLSYHPAAVLHNPALRPELLKDFKKLKKFIEQHEKERKNK